MPVVFGSLHNCRNRDYRLSVKSVVTVETKWKNVYGEFIHFIIGSAQDRLWKTRESSVYMAVNVKVGLKRFLKKINL